MVRFTPRELEVLKAVASGVRQVDAARDFGISQHTMKVHVGRLYDKTGMSSPVELSLWAIRKGIIHVPVDALLLEAPLED